MKTILSLLVLLTGSALQGADLSKHVFFKHFVGEWKAEGELKGENNNVVTIKEEWKGYAGGDSTFIAEGTRTLNGDTKPFKWTFTHNPSTDTFDALLEGDDPAQTLRFEATISEVNLTLELKTITGTNSAITVKESFTDDKHETINSQVTFVGDTGQTTLEGSIIHKKVKP
jgi:hypothetical protein